MTDVFISYSRKDIAFARLLHEALKDNDLETWIDWQDIPPSADWLAEVYEAIECADAFVFVISETSLNSEICGLEINHAAQHNKRLIPIVIKNVPAGQVPKELAVLNWIFFEEAGPKFAEAMEDLVTAITIDQDWVKTHTRFENRALAWDRKEGDRGLLLRGSDLSEAEIWLAGSAGKDPQPTALQTQFILKSREDSTRRQRLTLIGVGIGMLVAIVLGVVAWGQRNQYLEETYVRATAQAEAEQQRNIAEEQRNIAVSRQLSAQALIESDMHFDLAVLLSLESNNRVEESSWSSSNLLDILQLSPRITSFIRGHSNNITSVAVSPDNRILATGSGDSTIRLWNINNPTQPQLIGEPLNGHSSGVFTVAFSPDGRLLASGGGDDIIMLWDVSTPENPIALGKPLSSHTSSVRSVAFSPNGEVLVSGSYDSTIILWDVRNPGLAKKIGEPLDGHIDTVSSVAFSPNGDYLASGSFDRNIILWNVSDPWKIQQIGSPKNSNLEVVWSVAFSPNGKILAAADDDQNIFLWDVTNPPYITEYSQLNSEHVSPINCIAFSPDSKTLASGSVDRTIRLWDISSPQAPKLIGQPLVGHSSDVSSLVFSHDGRTLVSGGWDDTAIMWDVSNLQLPVFFGVQLDNHEGMVVDVAFSPDGQSLVSGGADKTITLWDFSNPEQPIPSAKPHA